MKKFITVQKRIYIIIAILLIQIIFPIFSAIGGKGFEIVSNATTGEWNISSENDGEIIAKLDEEGNLRITGNGKMKNWESEDEVEWKAIKENIKKVTIEEGITNIGTFAFSNCKNLQNIIIPESLIDIGAYSFCFCENLEEITLPEKLMNIGMYALTGCSKLKSIEIPQNITIIPEGLLQYCDGLTKIDLPKNVKKIEDNALSWTNNLESINVDENNEYISSYEGVLYNKEKTELISCPAGKKSTNLILPETVVTIKSNAFCRCNSLDTITISKSIKNIEKFAFYYCTSLKTMIIPTGIETIKEGTFESCSSLGKIVIPDTVTRIENNAFYLCKNLTIHCYENSYAEEYAKENKINYIIIKEQEEILEGETIYLANIKPNINIEEVILLFDTTGDIKVYDKDIEITDITKKVKTGMVLEEIKNDIKNRYIIVVNGDVNGDGKANLMDILEINKVRLKKKTLQKEYLKAADVNNDGKADLSDILQINKYRLGKVEL